MKEDNSDKWFFGFVVILGVVVVVLLTWAFVLTADAILKAERKAPAPVEMRQPVVSDPRFIIPEPYRAWVREAAAYFGIPQDIAARLGYEESRWNEKAMGVNANGTYDHNVYQMNSKYFPVKLTRAHIWEAMRHFRWCWDQGGSLTMAVIIWNAGLTGSKNPPAKSIELARRVVGGQL